MKRVFAIKLLTLSLLLSLCGCGATQSRISETAATRPASTITVDEVLWWLPEDTETLAVTHNIEKTNDEKNSRVYLSFADITIYGIKQGAFAKVLRSLPTSLVVEGSRKFRSTKSFGLLPFEGCTVIITKTDLPKERDLQKWLSQNASRTQTVFGHTMHIFDEKIEQDQWHFLVTQAGPNVWLYATNKKYLESVLRRRARSKEERESTRRALPPALTEWKYVDRNAESWALRHFRKDQAQLDPTSPLSGDQRMANVPDKNAIGVTYIFDKHRKIANVRYLTHPRGTQEMVGVYKNFWRSLIEGMGGISPETKKWQPAIQSKMPGVIEMRFDFSDINGKEKAGTFQFGLLALFGHAIIV